MQFRPLKESLTNAAKWYAENDYCKLRRKA